MPPEQLAISTSEQQQWVSINNVIYKADSNNGKLPTYHILSRLTDEIGKLTLKQFRLDVDKALGHQCHLREVHDQILKTANSFGFIRYNNLSIYCWNKIIR